MLCPRANASQVQLQAFQMLTSHWCITKGHSRHNTLQVLARNQHGTAAHPMHKTSAVWAGGWFLCTIHSVHCGLQAAKGLTANPGVNVSRMSAAPAFYQHPPKRKAEELHPFQDRGLATFFLLAVPPMHAHQHILTALVTHPASSLTGLKGDGFGLPTPGVFHAPPHLCSLPPGREGLHPAE